MTSRQICQTGSPTSSVECMGNDPEAVAQRWVRALSLDDLEAAVDCFDRAYFDEAPTRRGESVRGQDAVRQNFETLLSDLPDLTAKISRTVSGEDEVLAAGTQGEVELTMVGGNPGYPPLGFLEPLG